MKRVTFLMAMSCAVALSAASCLGQDARVQHGAEANREYATVFSRSDKPCMENSATGSYVECMNQELATIEAHLDSFVEDIRGMTGSPKELEGLNQSYAAFRTYRKSVSTLPFKLAPAGGTYRGPVSAESQWRIDRAYMQELSGIYILSQFPNRSPSQ